LLDRFGDLHLEVEQVSIVSVSIRSSIAGEIKKTRVVIRPSGLLARIRATDTFLQMIQSQ